MLVAGWRASDHVDVGMTFATALGGLAALRAAESLENSRLFMQRVALVGVATAAAYYVKETPALVIPAVLLFALHARGASFRTCATATAGSLLVAGALVLPWLLYTAHAFPELAAFARARGSRYFFHVVDGQGGPWYFHFVHLCEDFSYLAPVALLAVGWQSLRRRELRPLAGWAFLVYGVFTLAATKMEAYTMVAAPAVFAALGWFTWDLISSRVLRACILLAFAIYFGMAVLYIEGPLALRAPAPLWASELRRLGSEVERLPPGKRLVFVSDSPIECMFYTSATCVLGAPTPEKVAAAQARGFAVAAYGGSDVPGVISIPLDPLTLPARRLAGELRACAVKDVVVFNAREAGDLESYLGRSIQHVDVERGLPAKSHRLQRKLRRGATLVVLLPPGSADPPAVKAEFPDAVFIEDATYARALDSSPP
jgi:hypothetical protein